MKRLLDSNMDIPVLAGAVSELQDSYRLHGKSFRPPETLKPVGGPHKKDCCKLGSKLGLL